jgi:hypothetical protein
MIWQFLARLQTECRYMTFHRIHIITGDRPVAVPENVDLPVLKSISSYDHLYRRFICGS